MTNAFENPYRAPRDDAEQQSPPVEAGSAVEAASGDAGAGGEPPPPRRFRWRTIPAALSWFVASLMLIGGGVWAYQLWTTLRDASEADEFYVVAVVMMLTLCGASALNFDAGRRWVRGRWISALVANAGSSLLLGGTATVLETFVLRN